MNVQTLPPGYKTAPWTPPETITGAMLAEASNKLIELLPRWQAQCGDRFDARQGVDQAFFHDRFENVVLGGEVVHPAARLHARRLRDVAHRRAVIALLAKQARGCAQQLLATAGIDVGCFTFARNLDLRRRAHRPSWRAARSFMISSAPPPIMLTFTSR